MRVENFVKSHKVWQKVIRFKKKRNKCDKSKTIFHGGRDSGAWWAARANGGRYDQVKKKELHLNDTKKERRGKEYEQRREAHTVQTSYSQSLQQIRSPKQWHSRQRWYNNEKNFH